MTTNAYRPPAAFSVPVVLFAGALALAAPAAAQEDGFEPVTDAMLHDPDPDDWINWRRTLDGWGYSPWTRSRPATRTGCSSSGAGRSARG